jgi:hypothetical protein
MPGGLMQLVAYGAEDVYLTSDLPAIFFKVQYKYNKSLNKIDPVIYYKSHISDKSFTCPITHEITNNPVITICKHIFDKGLYDLNLLR